MREIRRRSRGWRYSFPIARVPLVTDPVPRQLASQLQGLSVALDEQIPPKRVDRNLLIATWNLREFGGLTPKWQSVKGDRPKRDLFSLRVIAEIVSRFDVIALQEVQEDIEALRQLVRVLGPENWGLILTDAARSQAGDRERLAFLYDVRRAKPSGLACELVVPDEQLRAGVGSDALSEQFAKTPYAVAFRCEGNTFILVTLHVKFGDKPADRLAELTTIARWMRDWADGSDKLNQNLIVLGDFNIDRKGDPNYEAFVAEGLAPPVELEGLPRTLPTRSKKEAFFDQIAWFRDANDRARLTLDYTGKAGNFKFNEHVLADMSRNDISFRISDHYPLWCEFAVPRR